jgi:hypothetical protein
MPKNNKNPVKAVFWDKALLLGPSFNHSGPFWDNLLRKACGGGWFWDLNAGI